MGTSEYQVDIYFLAQESVSIWPALLLQDRLFLLFSSRGYSFLGVLTDFFFVSALSVFQLLGFQNFLTGESNSVFGIVHTVLFMYVIIIVERWLNT